MSFWDFAQWKIILECANKNNIVIFKNNINKYTWVCICRKRERSYILKSLHLFCWKVLMSWRRAVSCYGSYLSCLFAAWKYKIKSFFQAEKAHINFVGTRWPKMTKITSLLENMSSCQISVWPHQVRQYTTPHKESLHSCSFWEASIWKIWLQFYFLGWVPSEICLTWEHLWCWFYFI